MLLVGMHAPSQNYQNLIQDYRHSSNDPLCNHSQLLQVVNSLLFHLIDSSVEFSQYIAVYEDTCVCLTFYLLFWLYLLKPRDFDIYLSISPKGLFSKMPANRYHSVCT